MKSRKVTLVSNTKNTFVFKDIELLEGMGHKVFLIYSPAFNDPIRFFWNRIREFFLSLFYLSQSDAVFTWFNDYHSVTPLWIARRLGLNATIIVGGYDAVSSPCCSLFTRRGCQFDLRLSRRGDHAHLR